MQQNQDQQVKATIDAVKAESHDLIMQLNKQLQGVSNELVRVSGILEHIAQNVAEPGDNLTADQLVEKIISLKATVDSLEKTNPNQSEETPDE